MSIYDEQKITSLLENQRSHYLAEVKQAAVLLLLVTIEDIDYIVFQKRNPDIRQGNEISFPGGIVDDIDESSLDTAIRETEEELRITKENIHVLGHLKSLISPLGIIIDCYVGKFIGTWEQPDFNHDEVAELFLAPVSFFIKHKPTIHHVITKTFSYEIINDEKKILMPSKELKLPEKYEDVWGMHKSNVYFFHYKQYTIWGLTARFVIAFCSLLRNTE